MGGIVLPLFGGYSKPLKTCCNSSSSNISLCQFNHILSQCSEFECWLITFFGAKHVLVPVRILFILFPSLYSCQMNTSSITTIDIYLRVCASTLVKVSMQCNFTTDYTLGTKVHAHLTMKENIRVEKLIVD